MKKVLVFAMALVLAGGVAYANFCARDIVPASSLLVPWGAVDLNADNTPNVNGWTTSFAITNVSADAVLVHFTLWSVQSTPVVDWDEILSGYDVWTMNFRDLLTGNFAAFDTGDMITGLKPAQPWGPDSNNAGLVPSLPTPADDTNPDPNTCYFPYGTRFTSLGPVIVQKLQLDQYAQPLQMATCKGSAVPATPPWLVTFGKNPVWFYLTADAVRACNTIFPNSSAYWATPKFPIVHNTLIGDIFWMNSAQNYSDSVPAVHLEADPQAANATQLAFYDRYSQGGPYAAVPVAEDDREPLATAFAFRYLTDFGVKTSIAVWKSTKEVDYLKTGQVNACKPYAYYAWDENEHSKARGGGGPSGFDTAEPNVLPWETQLAPVDSANWAGLPAANGWMLLVFDPSVAVSRVAPDYEQAWVGVRYILPGTPNYSSALEAATLANAHCFATQVLPQLGVNFNYTDGDHVPARY